MSEHTFAELFSAAVEAQGCSLAQLAKWLSARGFAVHRSTLGRWRDGTTRPGSDHLALLQRLPEAMGLAPDEAARFLRAVGQALHLPFGAGDGHGRPSPAFPHRRHLAGDDLPPFAGRATELAELQRYVLRRESVLITGPGGVGKTRLAQELLRVSVKEFTHGCEFLSLSADQDAAQVIRHIAHLLGLELQPEELAPDNRRLALGRLRDHVRGVSLLFLIDNVADADQVRELAQELRAITWVFTARSAGLKRIGVHPLRLRLPDAAEAVAIFRAHLPAAPIADRDDERLVCRVVDKVGGLPFALRLAAAVVGNRQAATVAELDAWLDAGGLSRAGSPTKKLQRLFDSMLAGVPTAARRTLLLCGAFPTPAIRLSAVQAVGEAAGVRPTPDDWAALEDYSLVEYPDDAHVALHARLHEHVRKRLLAEPSYPAVRAAFAAHYLALAESVSLGKSEMERDYRPLVGEEANLLAAADALHAAADWPGLRRLWPALTGHLWGVGDQRGYERADRLCLDAARALGDVAWAADILSEIGYVKKEAGDWAAAEALFVEAQAIYDAAPDAMMAQARLRRYRAEVALGMGRADGALALLADAERLLDSLPPEVTTLARMLLHSAQMTVHHRRGELAAAEAAGREAERHYELLRPTAIGHSYGTFRVELGDVLLRLGRVDEAAGQWAALVASRDGLPHLPEHAEAQLRLGWLAAERGEGDEAAELARAARETLAHQGQLARAEQADRLIAAIESGSPLPGFP